MNADIEFKQRSASLLLKLYDQRREPALRSAREWFVKDFHPGSAKEIVRLWVSEESAPYRMVTTYWEMAASLVTAGAIDPAMFHAANTEYVAVWAKIGPFLDEVRELVKLPDYLTHLEQIALAIPDDGEKLASVKQYLAHATRRTVAGFSTAAAPAPEAAAAPRRRSH